ncbi:MAG TPA: von Willebrand factor type A domain-containing protein [Thermoanaerobaculia bacterium]|nr:von Willebrand factor type A domain-containing protein [Thermoanaerobaculia bacterium]
MNDETHSDLRRRLAPGPTPPPPADLLARLKRDIPSHLAAAPVAAVEPGPSRQSLWAIAASLILLVNLAYFGPRFLMRDYRFSTASEAESAQPAVEPASFPDGFGGSRTSFPADPPHSAPPFPPAMAPPPPPPSIAVKNTNPSRSDDAGSTASNLSDAAAEEQQIATTESDAALTIGDEAPSFDLGSAADPNVRAQEASAKSAGPTAEVRPRLSTAQAATRPSAGDARAEAITITASAPAVPSPPVAPGLPPPDEEASPIVRPQRSGFAVPARGFVDASRFPTSRFGLSSNAGSFRILEEALRSGHLPDRDSIRVEELINHFDFGDAAPQSGSDFAIAIDGGTAPNLTRNAIHLVRIGVRARESKSPGNNLSRDGRVVAKDARGQVTFNPDVVAQYRLVGYEGREIQQAGVTIYSGHAVSALYELRLKRAPQSMNPNASVGKILLRYRDADGLGEKLVARSIELSSVAPAWRDSSPALRLAWLIAQLGEAVKRSGSQRLLPTSELALQIDALRRSFPGDRAVEDLAQMAERIAGFRP